MNRLRWSVLFVGFTALVFAPSIAFSSSDDADPLLAECRDSATRLEEQLGSKCRVIVRAPFVIAGDLTADELASWYADTIQPAARAMRTSYFKAPPDQAVTVLLFGTTESYRRHSQQLFGADKVTIYGYYKPNHRSVVVNLSTGGGTLVHELTHALIDFDFPDVPAWFNEGLASLHEQCRFRTSPRGTWIEGLVNWRLAGLQSVIREGRLRPISELVEDPEFRGRREGANYAQARYLCLYLQERGVLARFYREFRDHRATDPRGLCALARVLGDSSWRTLDEDFQHWALELSE